MLFLGAGTSSAQIAHEAQNEVSTTQDTSFFITVVGTVEAGVEYDCLILTTTGGSTYQLTGNINSSYIGQQVVVRGVLDPDGASYCMQGTPLHVISVNGY